MGRPPSQNMASQIIQEIYSQVQCRKKTLSTLRQEDAPLVDIANIHILIIPSYKWATGQPPARFMNRPWPSQAMLVNCIITLNGDTKNSVFSEVFKKRAPRPFY